MTQTEVLKSQIKELAEKHGLSLVVLFGSQATGATHPKSDVDIAVLGSVNFDRSKLLDDLGEIFQRDDIEIVNMAESSPTMMYVLIQGRQILI